MTFFSQIITQKNKGISFVFGIFSPKQTKFWKYKDFSNSLLFYTDFSYFLFFFYQVFYVRYFWIIWKVFHGTDIEKNYILLLVNWSFFGQIWKYSLFARFSLFWTENPKNKGNTFVFWCNNLRKKCQKLLFFSKT